MATIYSPTHTDSLVN